MLKNILLISVLLLSTSSIAHAGTNKVLLCHKTNSETNPSVMISVSENALEAQLALGSTLPRQLEDGSYTCTVEVSPE